MAKKKYRVLQSGLNISDESGQLKELERGEEVMLDNVPEFWASKLEEVKAGEDKQLEVASPSQQAEEKPAKHKKGE